MQARFFRMLLQEVHSIAADFGSYRTLETIKSICGMPQKSMHI